MGKKIWYLYIVEADDGCLYTGITTDIDRRLREHQGLVGKNRGAKFFRGRNALAVVYTETHDDRSSASKRESQIKKMSAQSKKALVKSAVS